MQDARNGPLMDEDSVGGLVGYGHGMRGEAWGQGQ